MLEHNSHKRYSRHYEFTCGVAKCGILSFAVCLVVGMMLIGVNSSDRIWNSVWKVGHQLRLETELNINSFTQIPSIDRDHSRPINQTLSPQQYLPIIKRLLQDNENSKEGGPIAQYVLIIIIILFVVVPFVALILFGAIILYRRCHQNQQHQHQYNMQTPTVQVQININDYKIDQIGPYLSNPNDQCSICLEKEVNVRTFCGHFFHGQCLKAWYDKKTTDGRSATCPVCVGSQINPVKIYCKKCFVSIKLDAIYCETLPEKIQELSNFKCNSCKGEQSVRSEITRKNTNKQQVKTNDNHEAAQSANKLYIENSI